MKTIAITGGKGGVGKSTIAILLANKFIREGKSVVLVDCDVECPNDYLLIGEKLSRPVDKVYAQFPKLIKEKCKKCALCAKNCRSNAVFLPKDGYPVFLFELCSGCSLCWHLCPQKAIGIEKRAIGEIFVNKGKRQRAKGKTARKDLKLNNFYLVTGKSKGIVDETGPIVTKTREFAQDFAQKIDADYLLIDTAPGMHCNVIRALIDVDLAYVVTEPTPLGAHDLELILALLRKLKVMAKVVLNQANLGDRRLVDKVTREFGVEIELEIPYSEEIVKAYSKGSLDRLLLLSTPGVDQVET